MRALGERGDWISFYGDLTSIVRVVLLALFASNEIYYPGDKWIEASMRRFGIEEPGIELWESIWSEGATPGDRAEATQSLGRFAESRLVPKVEAAG